MIILCRTCNKEFYISLSRINKRFNCSKKCLALNQRKGNVKNCGFCKKEFYSRPSRKQLFCSENCQHKGQIIHNRDIIGYKNGGTYEKGHEALKGEDNPNWKGGITPINIKKRNALRNWNRTWARLVKERDGQCKKCGKTVDLEADHILPLKYYPELQTSLDNGQALCIRCHQAKTQQDKFVYA